VGDIAESEEIPRPFASKILKDFVRAGILRSSRGPGGGYALVREVGDVTLLEIREVLDGAGDLERCAVGLDLCSEAAPCPLHDVFKPLRESIRAYLSETTLADMSLALDRKRALMSRGSK